MNIIGIIIEKKTQDKLDLIFNNRAAVYQT